MTRIILVQGFCPLKTKTARYPIGFRLNGYCAWLRLSLPVKSGKHVVTDGEELHDSFIKMKIFKSFK